MSRLPNPTVICPNCRQPAYPETDPYYVYCPTCGSLPAKADEKIIGDRASGGGATISGKDIEQLKTLRDFLRATFPGSSVNGLKIDDMADLLDRAIPELERSDTDIGGIKEVEAKLEISCSCGNTDPSEFVTEVEIEMFVLVDNPAGIEVARYPRFQRQNVTCTRCGGCGVLVPGLHIVKIFQTTTPVETRERG